VAQWQNVIYNEFLVKLLGQTFAKQFQLKTDVRSIYDPAVNPSIKNGFAAASFR